MERVAGVLENQVPLRIGKWNGEWSFMFVPMDDFKIVPGKEFTRKVKETSMPHL